VPWWPGKTVTEYDDHLFCLLTMNRHPLHLDARYAQESTEFGKNVVVGNHVYSLLLGMSVPDMSRRRSRTSRSSRCGTSRRRVHGDTIYGETTVPDKRESASKPDLGAVHVDTIGYNQHGTVGCIFRRKMMSRRRAISKRAAAISRAAPSRPPRLMRRARNAVQRGKRRWPAGGLDVLFLPLCAPNRPHVRPDRTRGVEVAGGLLS
jgi:acyl dehydratase